MGNTNVKKKIFSGLVWKFGERISAQLVTFIVSIFLARLLEPAHYGAIAIVNIFIALANVFVESSFGSALIQKKDADNIDFSSVLYCNIFVSMLIYILIYCASPYIAHFYDMEILSPVLRVLGLRIIVAAVNSVQHAYVSRHMLFRKFFLSTLGGTLLSGVVGIVMAYKGYGIWALVAQYMTNTTIDTIVLWFTVKWRPALVFSFHRVKSLFSYGWKILVSSLLSTVYSKIKSMIIGKFYAPESFAYYSKGDQFPSIIVTNINSSIQSVLFPAMSEYNDEMLTLKIMIRRSVMISSYIMFPLMAGMQVLAKPIIYLLLTEKWSSCIPFLQISCFVYALMPIHTANLQAIKALGRSDVYLKLEIIKKILGLVLFFLVIKHGVLAVAISGAFVSFASSFINAYPNKKLIGYSYLEQLRDIMPATLCTLAMSIVVTLISVFVNMSYIATICVCTVVGMVTYVVVSHAFKVQAYVYILNSLSNWVHSKK